MWAKELRAAVPISAEQKFMSLRANSALGDGSSEDFDRSVIKVSDCNQCEGK